MTDSFLRDGVLPSRRAARFILLLSQKAWDA
jgi:hypothetical protein